MLISWHVWPGVMQLLKFHVWLGVIFTLTSGLPCSSSPELELRSMILVSFTLLTGFTLMNYGILEKKIFSQTTILSRNNTDVSFNDVLLFSKMPPYFELKLELYSFLLSDQSMVWLKKNQWIEWSIDQLCSFSGWWHCKVCAGSKVIVQGSGEENCQNS